MSVQDGVTRRSVTNVGSAFDVRDADAAVIITDISAGVGWNAILRVLFPRLMDLNMLLCLLCVALLCFLALLYCKFRA